MPAGLRPAGLRPAGRAGPGPGLKYLARGPKLAEASLMGGLIIMQIIIILLIVINESLALHYLLTKYLIIIYQ